MSLCRLFWSVATAATIEVTDFVNPAFDKSFNDQLLFSITQSILIFIFEKTN
jgi:hypothetical protein